MNAAHSVRRWPLALIALPAAVAIWSGWVGLGGMCGFGLVQPLPGIVGWHLDTAITLPVGVEAYGAYALGAWLTPSTPEQARTFARRSAIGALALGMLGQVVYHLLTAAHAARAPWPVVVLVSCLPVVTLGFGAALTHLLRAAGGTAADGTTQSTPREVPAAGPGAPGADDGTARAGHPGGSLRDGEAEAPGDGTAPPPPVAAAPDGETGNPRTGSRGDDLARLFAEQMDQARGLPPHGSGAPEITPEAGGGTVHREPPPAAPEAGSGTVPALVPYDAESAALIALRATIAAGNGYSNNQLMSKFGLTRAQAAKVRQLAGGPPELTAVNGRQFGAADAETSSIQ